MALVKGKKTETETVEETKTVVAKVIPEMEEELPKKPTTSVATSNEELVDRIEELFMFGPKKLPIVETITYTSRVPWLKGRPAWIADYASHFKTSRHFIARSLNRKADYYTQKVSPGDRFNVLRSDINVEFYLLIDVSRCTLDFYYHDKDHDEKVLLKTYKVSLGSIDHKSDSGTVTPLGKFYLGDKIATYKPGVMGYFQNERVEMIRVFGSRWIPFKGINDDEDALISGYGIHGVPLSYDETSGDMVEDESCLGQYNSLGCVRLKKEDIEELYAIVVTRPTLVEIVRSSSTNRD